jgi:glutamine synthetase type III
MGMKEWALAKGVTHYTHCLASPGTTAENTMLFF